MGKISNIKIASLLAIIFFIAGIATITNYGINWDTINHLPRGQAYLQYFLTGKKDYSDLPKYSKNSWQNPSVLTPQTKGRSFYQSDETDFNYYMQYDGYGHPPLSDILSSIFNRIIYGKLGLINDIDSYHIYGILVASLLICLIFYWISKEYGKLSGLISSLFIAMYPLFWSESHFNTEKDIPETVFWSFFLFCVWKGIKNKSSKWVLISGLFFGLALGTKFNILFVGFVVLPWALYHLFINHEKILRKPFFKITLASVVAILTGIIIFVASWPYLWSDPIGRVQQVFSFYKGLGIISGVPDPRFMGPLGINTYPVLWIIFTTPPIILIAFIFGVVYIIKHFRKDSLLILFVLWLIVPILRVTWHGANIYGGIRQIMEYVPALAIIGGIGTGKLINSIKLKKKNLKALNLITVVVVFISLAIPILTTHPSENVYFNFLIGGLNGAKEKNIPSWGNTFGAAYRPALYWIDQNVPKGANLDLVNELLPNIPLIWIRSDINFSALNRSGYLRKGEYALTLNYQGTNTRSYYDMYLTTFLNPVYQEKVDGIPVVTVWKNDDAHLKQKWIEKKIPNIKTTKDHKGLYFDLGKVYKISRLDMAYQERNCTKMTQGVFEISPDGKSWITMPDKLPDDWTIAALGEQPKNGKFIEPFVGEEVRYVNFNLSPNDTCLLKNYTSVNFFALE